MTCGNNHHKKGTGPIKLIQEDLNEWKNKPTLG